MRALSIKQPWASLVASGRKTVELRTWTTKYRGPLLVCAGRSWDKRGAHWVDGPRGLALCVVELADVRPATADDAGAACIDIGSWDGVYAWELGDVHQVVPFPVSGQLGLFSVELIATGP